MKEEIIFFKQFNDVMIFLFVQVKDGKEVQ